MGLVRYRREVEAALEQLRASLRARYGWTHIELEVRVDRARGLLCVEGEVAVRKLAAPIRAIFERMPLEGLELELRLHPLSALAWHELPREGLELWAEHPVQPRRELATQLEPDDGPVAVLGQDHEGMLLRARDGTVGWARRDTLGAVVCPRPLGEVEPRDEPPGAAGGRICAAAREFLGVPYRLGGASHQHIDCSALVQRAYTRGIGVLLPRNSRDQLAVAGGGSTLPQGGGQPGDLLFIHSRRMQRMHVGILAGQGTILHASRTHSAVIEQPEEVFERDAAWSRHVEWKHLCTWARTQAGRESVDLPSAVAPTPAGDA